MEQMNRECVILPQVLKTAGYATGMFGKWHLGDENGHEPWKRGFDVGVIAPNDAEGIAHKQAVDPVFLFNGTPKRMKGTRDVCFAREAVNFMSQEREEPFFCYYATYDPHRDHWAESRFVKQAGRLMEQAKRTGLPGAKDDRKHLLFAEVLRVDWIPGGILDFLDEKGHADNTLVFLVTDNGATDGVDAYNKGMRGYETTAWVGGTRALAYWSLPGVPEPRDLTERCAHIDVLPTMVRSGSG